MKEMVGGCCVCSDERGWPENPLVYCDGQHCTVAVHQACYGIVTVPTGPWFCRKCESQERSTRVRCELCPSKDGALKRTDNASWAHVVCALYIPEVRFGNVTTMEPIILQLIPQERFAKVCYICQDLGKGSKANIGACMQCNKSGCKQQFHVTCAQALGLLCEEAGNYLDNVKYCGYCQHHYSKLKKGGNVKTIPPYKPVSHNVDTSDPSSSPEKDNEPVPMQLIPSTAQSAQPVEPKQSSQNGSHKSAQRKSTSNSSSTNVPSSSQSATLSTQQSSFSSKQPNSQSQSANQNQSIGSNTSGSSTNLSTDSLNVSGGDSGNSVSGSTATKDNSSSKASSKSTSKSSTSTKGSSKESREPKHSKPSRNHSKDSQSSEFDNLSNVGGEASLTPTSQGGGGKDVVLGQKFTTSNFTETVVVNSDSVFGATKTGPNVPVVKKRKLDSNKSSSSSASASNINDELNREIIKDVSVTLVPLPFDKVENSVNESKKQKCSEAATIQSTHISVNTASNINKGEDSSHHITPTSAVSLVVSVPLSTATLSGVNLPSNTNTAATIQQIPTIKSFAKIPDIPPNAIPINRSHTYPNIIIQQPADLPDKESLYLSEKQQQSIASSGAIVRNPSPLPSAVTNKLSAPSDSGKPGKISLQPIPSTTSDLSGSLTAHSGMASATITTMGSGSNLKITYEKNTSNKNAQLSEDVSLSRISSTPDDNSNSFSDLKITYEAQSNHMYDTASITPRSEIKHSPPSSPTTEVTDSHKRNHSSSHNDAKDMKMFPAKDMHATHMLGNQLNPASSVAQKMSDQLYMEMEAQSSVYTPSTIETGAQLIGPMFPGKQLSNARSSAAAQPQGPSLSSMLGGTGMPTAHGNTPQSLEQLLERQWEQGSQFLMEQAQHFDIASLLSCLHQLRAENIRLEEHVNNLVARRDHLLAVNARLAIPLNQVPPTQNQNSTAFNSLHLNGTAEPPPSRVRSQHLK